MRADVERTVGSGGELAGVGRVAGGGTGIVGMREGDEKEGRKGGGEDSWVEVTVEVAGQQQQQQQRGGGGGGETAMGFLEQVLWEGLVGDDGGGGGLRERLRLGERWHWRLFVDVRDTYFPFFWFCSGCLTSIMRLPHVFAWESLTLTTGRTPIAACSGLLLPPPQVNFSRIQILLLSPPHSYPLPLLSLTVHLALLTTRLPAPISSPTDDPLFADDWAAALPLYAPPARPPVTVLVMAVGENVFFDPSREELAVADAVVAVSFCRGGVGGGDDDEKKREGARGVRLLAVRTVEPPGRQLAGMMAEGEGEGEQGWWKRRRGGVSRAILARMVALVVDPGGVGEEVLAGLEGWPGAG